MTRHTLILSSRPQLAGENGAVYKCLIAQFANVDLGCQKELTRALHMAFYIWAPSAVLTLDCDDDIHAQCTATRPNLAKTPGAVAECLAEVVSCCSTFGLSCALAHVFPVG